MKKKIRVALLVVAGALVYFAKPDVSTAFGCDPECWDNGFGQICCTNEHCIDYCL